MRLGFHVSISGGFSLAARRAYELGCTTMQIFSRNPRGWTVKPLDPGDIAQFKDFANGEDGIAYERKMDRILETIERCPLPTVAAVAALDPQTAANRPEPRMFTWMSRPGMRSSQGARPAKSARFVFADIRISFLAQECPSLVWQSNGLRRAVVPLQRFPVGAVAECEIPGRRRFDP